MTSSAPYLEQKKGRERDAVDWSPEFSRRARGVPGRVAGDERDVVHLADAFEARYNQPAVDVRRPIEPIFEDSTASLACGASASTSWGMTRMGPSTLVCITWSKSSTVGVCSPLVRGP